MRIFYAAQATPNEISLPGSKLWYVNLYLPLVDLGHELIPFAHPWLSGGYNVDLNCPAHARLSRGQRPDFSQELVDSVKAAHQKKSIQVFFSYLTSAHVEPEAIRQIAALGITTINWYCNASYQFHNIAEIAPAYHYCLVPEKFRLSDYRRVGANPIYCQEAANPNVYRPHEVPFEFDVTFVGQKYANRPQFLRRLVDAEIDVRVWGPNWNKSVGGSSLWKRAVKRAWHSLSGRWNNQEAEFPADRCGPPLSDDELVRMYSRSKISLGFTTVAEGSSDSLPPVKQVRLRDFEATMSGAFYMVEYLDELAEFFEPDREIVVFQNAEELVEKAKYYLVRDDERERIRRAGMQRARTDHTWQNRFQTIFRRIGLS